MMCDNDSDSDMQVHAVIYHPTEFPDKLYNDALSLLDPETQSRINRFYHRQDACRSLIGHLLIRKKIIDERGSRRIRLSDMRFSKTQEGKPYFLGQPPIAYNIAHDNAVIVLAYDDHSPVVGGRLVKPPAFSLGIDIMKVEQRKSRKNDESIDSFIRVFHDQLTLKEQNLLSNTKTSPQKLEKFFQIWTFKEAYTKALGLGLGFDFKRIQIEFESSLTPTAVTTLHPLDDDEEGKTSWKFNTFTIMDGVDRYVGVIAELGRGGEQEVSVLPNHQLTIFRDAVAFTQDAIAVLSEQPQP